MTQQEINRLAATTPAAHARREQPAARVGQVWKSTDRREDRWVRVVEIDAQFAVVEPCEPTGEPHHNPRRTRVRLSPTGRLTRYRLVQDPPLPGLDEDTDQRRSERPTTPTPTHTTPEASSAAYGHAAAVKRPSPATPGRWQLPPEPDVPRLRDAAGLHALAEEFSAHAQVWDERDDPDGHAAAWDALHTLLTAAGAWVEHVAKIRPDLAPAAVDDIVTAVRRLAAHLTVAEGDHHV